MGREEGGLSGTDHLTEAELIIPELPTDEVGAGVSGMGAVSCGVGDNGVRGRVLKGEERIREKIQGVGDTSGACLRNKDVMATIVGKGGGDIKPRTP